jgi:uncharacterized protein HemX
MTDTEKQDETSNEVEVEPATEAQPDEDVSEAQPAEDVSDAQPDAGMAGADETLVPDQAAAADVPPAPVDRKRGGGIAWVALLVAFVAAAGAGYGLLQDLRESDTAAASDRDIAELNTRLRDVQQSVSSNNEALDALGGADTGIGSRIDAVEQDIDSRVRLFESLPARMSNLEESVAALQGLSAGARNALLLAEAEYYMQIANAQLQLAGNPELALMALNMADDRIVQLADPSLTEVRRALSDELASLEGIETPDIEGITLTLASLSRVAETLPLRRVDEEQQASEATDGEEAGGMQRAWSSVKGAFSGLVTVRKADETERALLAPDAIYFLRANLSLQLEAARLALLRGEQSIFEQSLDDADAWLSRYFDTADTQVVSARETIAEIRGGMIEASMPDISGSLKLLRQYQVLNESAQ